MKYFLIGVLSLVMASAAFAGDRTISVSGEGTVTATPDVAYINLEIVSEQDTVSKAMAKSKASTKNVLTALANNKVADKDICVKNFTLSPRYKYIKDQDPQLVGYSVVNGITVTVRDLDKAGSLLDALTADGHASVISGIAFDVLDKTKISDEAREAAVTDAVRKAKLMTKAAGSKLGKVVTIHEGGTHLPRYAMASTARSMNESADSFPLHTKGEQQFKVSVNVVFSIED